MTTVGFSIQPPTSNFIESPGQVYENTRGVCWVLEIVCSPTFTWVSKMCRLHKFYHCRWKITILSISWFVRNAICLLWSKQKLCIPIWCFTKAWMFFYKTTSISWATWKCATGTYNSISFTEVFCWCLFLYGQTRKVHKFFKRFQCYQSYGRTEELVKQVNSVF